MKNVQSAMQEERNRRFQPSATALVTGQLQKKQPVQKKENRSVLVQETAVKLNKKTQFYYMHTLMNVI